MEFKHEELVEREVIIARLLVKGFSVKEISDQTGMGKRIVAAHIRNMKVKLQARDLMILIRTLQQLAP
jgi:DNA-binding NarL/FixJ family response regulator